jgi:hypothetical protein
LRQEVLRDLLAESKKHKYRRTATAPQSPAKETEKP